MNRAIAKRMAIESREDVRYFQSRLAKATRRGLIRAHAFCLMGTHFHVLAESPRGRVADAMHVIQNQYTRYFNRSRRRDGALWRNRYRSRVVNSDAYRRNVVRYIDANPIVAGLTTDSARSIRCSARHYTRDLKVPWLCRDWVESQLGVGSGAAVARAYRNAFEPNVDPSFRRWIERRLEGTSNGDLDFDDLVSASPAAVREWMIRKAALADGTAPGLHVLPVSTVRELVDGADAAVQRLKSSIGRTEPVQVVSAGLLRDVAGCGFAEIAKILNLGRGTVHRHVGLHRKVLADDSRYASLIARRLRRAIESIA